MPIHCQPCKQEESKLPIFIENSSVKVGGVLLPGALKSIEVTQEAAIDEVEVEGAAVKPKQAVGYEDAKIKLELIVDASANQSADDKLAQINALFHPKGQSIPQPVDMLCKETAAAGIGKVLFQKITHKWTNKSDQYAVTMEFCQYVPAQISVATGAGRAAVDTAAGTAALSPGFQDYLDGERGGAPKIIDKTAATPATDKRKYGPMTREQLDRLHRLSRSE